VIPFLKRLVYEPVIFFGFGTGVLALAAGVWSSDILAFTAAVFAFGGTFVTRTQTVSKKWADEQPTGFVDLEAS